ncbi:MAG: HisA/HisF-related TIM barrel protein, partial [Ottowia sp.]
TTRYDRDPAALIAAYREQGAQQIHLVDLDGAKDPAQRQTALIARLAASARCPIQVGGGIRSADDIAALLAAGAWMQPGVMAVIGIYLALNLAYSFGLKHQPVIDIFIVASGFVLRALAGAVALEVKLSSWMFVTTLCLALYMAAIKRRQELARSGDKGRQVLQRYSLPLIERYAEMSATGALVFYSLYVMSAHPELIVSIPLVLFGLFRYWYVVEMKKGGESPTDVLLSDWQLMATVLAWLLLCAWRLAGS